MSLPSINPTTTKAWKKLSNHFNEIEPIHLNDLFSSDEKREDKMSIEWKDFYVDFSKNRVSDTTINLLLELAEEVKLKEAIQLQFSGEKINQTEGRAVLHTALRDFNAMKPEVKETLQKMKLFSEKIENGTWKGYTGKPITDIVNIGIGGSDLGPKMVTETLKYYKNHLEVHYVSNIDGDHVAETLKNLNRETTLFIVVSKTFTTIETLTNAITIKKWFLENATITDVPNHFVAVSTNEEKVLDFGISNENIFTMWDWVGGRFSLWSAVSLSTCCAIGYTNFEELLQGAHEMDVHFKETDFSENIPVILSVLSIWYTNFYNAESEVVVSYSQYLSYLVPYLQQAFMESNGKSIDRNGEKVDYQTGTIVWGSTGTNAQHAFFQLLHQGTKIIPIDFIGFSESLHGNKEHQDILIANLLAQSEALAEGTAGTSIASPFKEFEGNKPSNTLLIKKLTPKNFGALLALYEHKLFVQGIIWNVFSFDQWGVELGKKNAQQTLNAIKERSDSSIENKSTKNLLNQFLK
ncbi:MAG: glucose-6-phosphate isomerase [Flavobacteriaceae bacterium]|jgi:glucose-6-phosphate isomerase|uniref:glucose-6-phosphate isomerase n=1 Tax=Candidatus Marifrigoribacter sp. Uisw_064 TaxID=3230970 RepID=UPI003AE2EC43